MESLMEISNFINEGFHNVSDAVRGPNKMSPKSQLQMGMKEPLYGLGVDPYK